LSEFDLQYIFQSESNNVISIETTTTKYIRISKDILSMRKVQIGDEDFVLREQVELVYEKKITPFGNSAKIDAPKKYRGWRAYVVIVKD
jgi:putative transposon-encoded protein